MGTTLLLPGETDGSSWTRQELTIAVGRIKLPDVADRKVRIGLRLQFGSLLDCRIKAAKYDLILESTNDMNESAMFRSTVDGKFCSSPRDASRGVARFNAAACSKEDFDEASLST
jgi:hypothetical protein